MSQQKSKSAHTQTMASRWAFARENRSRIVANEAQEDMPQQSGKGWSYVVSALYKTSPPDSSTDVLAYVPYLVDLVLHVGLWIVALVLEIVIRTREHRGARVYEEVGTAALATLGISLGGVALSVLVGAMADLKHGSLYPSIVSAITAGGTASAVFSAMYWLTAVQDMNYMSHKEPTKTFFSADHADDELVTTRQLLLWLVALKLLAVGTVRANMRFMPAA